MRTGYRRGPYDGGWLGFFGLCVLAVAVCVGGGLLSGEWDTSVDAPSARDSQEISEELARASAAQKICYGWRLTDDTGRAPDALGSNLGPGIAVSADPQGCPSWVQVQAVVHYTPSDNEWDTAGFWVTTSDNLASRGPGMESGLGRLGIDEGAFLDDPAGTIARAALTLPLVAAETQAADELPVSRAENPAQARPPGRDFWRDGPAYVFGAVALLTIAVILVVVGRSRQTRPAPQAQSRRVRQARAQPAEGGPSTPPVSPRRHKTQRRQLRRRQRR